MSDTDTKKKMLVVSSIPAATNYGTDSVALAQFSFKEAVPVDELHRYVVRFIDDLSTMFNDLPAMDSFELDTIEVSGVMAADGRLGLMGSSIGGKAEGAIKFVLKRKD